MPRRPLSTPSELFDAAVDPRREHELHAEGLEVVARPGMPAPTDISAPALAIRRARGEARLALLFAVNRLSEGRSPLEAEGIECEGYGDGVFAEVYGGEGSRPMALRIAGPGGLTRRDTVLLQAIGGASVGSHRTFTEDEPPAQQAPRQPETPAPELPQPSQPEPVQPSPPEPGQPSPPEPVRQSQPEPVRQSQPAATPQPQAPQPARLPQTATPEPAQQVAPLQLPAISPATAREDVEGAEGIKDAIAPPRAPLAITADVGRGGRNNAADVRAVQDRLVELRVLEQADAETERPGASGMVAETAIARTIAAIEAFQRQHGIPADAKVSLKGGTRVDLDRAIRPPPPAEFTAITTARNAVRQAVSRGLALTGAVGASTTGNAPDDVRAVQRRLVELGRLPASHGEAPVAATGPVPQANLRATIAALRAFQSDVQFWKARGTIAGAITPGAAAPGDATAAHLAAVSVYTMGVGPTQIVFRDHVASGVTRSEAGVAFTGTAAPSAIPLAEYRAQGLTATQAAALQLVSTHEGNFDAINTYDRALVSVGFIQFAGSRGLPRYLALLKARQPTKFRDLLQNLGIDVEFVVSRGAIDAARTVVLDPAGSRILRAAAAEAAIRDDKKLTAALILSGRDRDVQRVQIEAAIRDYVLPALAQQVSWGAAAARAPLGELLRSGKGMAALFDRAIQEGVGIAKRRFERIIQRVVSNPDPKAPPVGRADVQSREGDVLAELERDLQAAADVAGRIARARSSIETLAGAARAAGATVAAVLARPELLDARRAITEARAGLSQVVNVSTPPSITVDTAISTMRASLGTEESRLAFTPPPPSPADLAASLAASRTALAAIAGPVSTAAMFLRRVQAIRRSTLDASLAEAAA